MDGNGGQIFLRLTLYFLKKLKGKGAVKGHRGRLDIVGRCSGPGRGLGGSWACTGWATSPGKMKIVNRWKVWEVACALVRHVGVISGKT